MKRLAIICFLILLAGCSGTATSPVDKPAKKTDTSKSEPATVMATSVAGGPQRSDSGPYVYTATSRRDPFRSLLVRTPKVVTGTPLQQRGLGEIKVVGIIWDKTEYMAMVETPDGKGYTLRIGTSVGPGKGRVRKITDKEVVVAEDYNDFYGVKKSKETTLELHTKEEELE